MSEIYIVTGGAGFIGSRLVAKLNAIGIDNILVVDNLKNSQKFKNLLGLHITDYMDKWEFLAAVEAGHLPSQIGAIFHQGACSDTAEQDGQYMMNTNFTYSKVLFNYALANNISFIYASSAAVYGNSHHFMELIDNEHPINVYGYSKMLFDHYVRRHLSEATNTVVGLRYFNVYGYGEMHKKNMASVVYQFYKQLKQHGSISLFKGTHGYCDGEQRRDFVCVEDVAQVNSYFLQHPGTKNIFNVGTGYSRSFNEIAKTLIHLHGTGDICYIDVPEYIYPQYQSFTEADLNALRQTGYVAAFIDLEHGIERYYRQLEQTQDFP